MTDIREDIKVMAEEFMKKMPKEKVQLWKWAQDYVDTQLEVLSKSGLDNLQMLGVIQMLEARLKDQMIRTINRALNIK